jgi:Effector Associated Constant Component 1
MSELRLEIGLEPDADAAELEGAASQLQQELLELDVDTVERPAGAPPPGTRGVEIGIIGTLVVGAGRAAIGPVVNAISAWVARRSSRTVRITLDGDSLELTNASAEDQRRLIESFVARHAAAAPP